MADQRKFEKMLELLVNEDREAAEELFHEIVVEKSRDIYQSLIEEKEDDDDEEVEEGEYGDDDDDDEVDEGFDLDEFEVEGDDEIGGDATDDLMTDLGMDDEESDGMDDMDGMDDEGEDDEVEDRVDDLEDALEDLKAEFDKMMSGDDDMGDDDMGDDDMGDDDMGDDDMDDDDDDDDMNAKEGKMYKKKSSKMTDGEHMREYVEKVSPATSGDNGANAQSTVAGKNDMGGTTQNIARNDTENGVEANKGNLKGSSLTNQSPKEMNTKNINVPGGKAGKTAYKKREPGHGAEKKGKPETSDKAATSTLNNVSTRAK